MVASKNTVLKILHNLSSNQKCLRDLFHALLMTITILNSVSVTTNSLQQDGPQLNTNNFSNVVSKFSFFFFLYFFYFFDEFTAVLVSCQVRLKLNSSLTAECSWLAKPLSGLDYVMLWHFTDAFKRLSVEMHSHSDLDPFRQITFLGNCRVKKEKEKNK